MTPQTNLTVENSQAKHRLRLLDFWQIPPGSRVLEIGCGQGDCTAVLAEAVGPTGHVDAVDPGSPDYGAPVTLAEAQAQLSASAVGERITWHCADPVEFLAQNLDKTWDCAVLAHCIWYFDSSEPLKDMLAALKGRVGAILVAEYALRATEKDAMPHVLAAMARATLETYNKASTANIRSLFSPDSIKNIVHRIGWILDRETIVVPGQGLEDGHWETSTVKSEEFLKEIEQHVTSTKMKALLCASRDAVIGSLESMGGERARTMDVWVTRFT